MKIRIKKVHPDAVLHSDGGELRPEMTRALRGAHEIASSALTFTHMAPYVRPALINGAAGVVVTPQGEPFSVMGFTVTRPAGTKDSEFQEYARLLRQQGVDLSRAARVLEPSTGRRWLHVWSTEVEAERFAAGPEP